MKAVTLIAVGESDQKVITKTIDGGNTSYYFEGDTFVVPKLSTESLVVEKI